MIKGIKWEKEFDVLFSILPKQMRLLSNGAILIVALFLTICIFTLLHQNNKNTGFLTPCPGDTYLKYYQKKDEKIPNVIHFYRNHIESGTISRSELINIETALEFHEFVNIHTENLGATQKALNDVNFTHESLYVLSAPVSSHLPPVISILWNHGGIFLHNDVFLLRGLDNLRHYDKFMSIDGSIVAASKSAIEKEWFSESTWKTEDIVLNKDWGALYIPEAIQNCSIKAVRLGFDARTRLSWIQDYIK